VTAEHLDGIPARVEVHDAGQVTGELEQGERARQAGVLARLEGNHLHGNRPAVPGRAGDVQQLVGHDRPVGADSGAPADYRFI
jgi:hypothetical protein